MKNKSPQFNFPTILGFILPLILFTACATTSPALSASDREIDKSVTANTVESELEVKREIGNGDVIITQKPCRLNKGGGLQRKPEIKAGISKKIGSKEENAYVEYDCGTTPSH